VLRTSNLKVANIPPPPQLRLQLQQIINLRKVAVYFCHIIHIDREGEYKYTLAKLTPEVKGLFDLVNNFVTGSSINRL